MAKHITGNTTIMGQAVIPFGSNDESVVLQCDLKSAASVVASGGAETGSPTYSENGMANQTDADHVTFFDYSGYAALDISGQISFDTDIKYIANKHDFHDATLNGYLVTWADDDSGAAFPFGRFFKKTTDQLQVELASGDTELILSISGDDTNERCTITLSWDASYQYLYIDGRFISSTPRANGVTADLMKAIWIGSLRGVATGLTGIEGYSVSNLIVSSRPVMIPTHPVMSRVVIIGHSFVASVAPYPVFPTVGSYGWDKDIPRCITGYLANKGVLCYPTVHAESGATLDTTIGAAANLDAEFTAAIALNPTCAIIIAGTNDITEGVDGANFDAVTFESEYKGYIDSLSATCQQIIVTTVPSSIGKSTQYSPAIIANTASVNSIINALPDYNAKCVVSDSFTLLGGESIGNNYFNGEYTGVFDDRHPMPKACRLIGEDIGKKIYFNFGG